MVESFVLETSLIHRLGEVARRADRAVERALAPLGLTRLKWHVLLGIGQEGIDSPSALADFVGVDRAIISRNLSALEAAGMVKVSSGGTDKRKRRLQITASGTTALENGCKEIDKITNTQFAPLRERQRIRLLQFCDALAPVADPADLSA